MITETLTYSNYEIKDWIQSKIDPSVNISTATGFYCPHCNEFNTPLNHGETITCTCGLIITLCGNALDCKLKE